MIDTAHGHSQKVIKILSKIKKLNLKKIKQIDIIDNLYPYHKWTSHFRNYNYISREPFKNLTKKIINLV